MRFPGPGDRHTGHHTSGGSPVNTLSAKPPFHPEVRKEIIRESKRKTHLTSGQGHYASPSLLVWPEWTVVSEPGAVTTAGKERVPSVSR